MRRRALPFLRFVGRFPVLTSTFFFLPSYLAACIVRTSAPLLFLSLFFVRFTTFARTIVCVRMHSVRADVDRLLPLVRSPSQPMTMRSHFLGASLPSSSSFLLRSCTNKVCMNVCTYACCVVRTQTLTIAINQRARRWEKNDPRTLPIGEEETLSMSRNVPC